MPQRLIVPSPAKGTLLRIKASALSAGSGRLIRLTLNFFAPDGKQVLELSFGFHAFGDHLKAQFMRRQHGHIEVQTARRQLSANNWPVRKSNCS